MHESGRNVTHQVKLLESVTNNRLQTRLHPLVVKGEPEIHPTIGHLRNDFVKTENSVSRQISIR